MSKKKHRRKQRSCNSLTGTIYRVIDGLGDALGVGRGLVIAGFVVGFVFVPLLSVAVFLGGWYWITYPDRTQAHFRHISAYAQRAARRVSEAAFSTESRKTATEPDFDAQTDTPQSTQQPSRTTAADVTDRFAELDARAKAIEEFVASEEYRLEKEFKRIRD